MPIQADKNTSYGPTLVNQKYSPLLNIQYPPGDAALYGSILTNRWNFLRNDNLIPERLNLIVGNWNKTVNSETGKNPPLVVISSNRANWIVAGFNTATRELRGLGIRNFTNVGDLRALAARTGNQDTPSPSPPVYCPKRLGNGGARNVYIVVHEREYSTYKEALRGFDVTIVGWGFRRAAGAARELVGFGASRFAAIEFCKTLRHYATRSGVAPWAYAWLLDDNVVGFTGSFAGYQAVETAIAGGGGRVCVGFRGGSSADTTLTVRDWARTELGAGRGTQAAALPTDPAAVGIVQQASLWNIAYLTTHHLNFSPSFIASGEDVSMVNYFNSQDTAYLFYGGIGVTKEVPAHDNGTAAGLVNAARQTLTTWMATQESADAAVGVDPPPPVEIRPTNEDDGDVQSVAAFVEDCVLPNASMPINPANIAAAKCQAVEQIMCGAIDEGHVPGGALATTFQINGTGNQDVYRAEREK